MFTGQCHCGNISFKADHKPESLTECNCSICNRYGSKWAYYKTSEVSVTFKEQDSTTYRWGDRVIDFHHCPICGCMTHYTGTEESDEPMDRIAVNARMVHLSDIEGIKVRHFDGADSWTFLD